MSFSIHVFVFLLRRELFAVDFSVVERVLPAMEVRPLPGSPDVVCGVINVAGEVRPVIDLRQRFGMPVEEMRLSDCLVLARTERRHLALLVDAVEGMASIEVEEPLAASGSWPRVPHVQGIAKRPEGMVLIHDLEACLSLDEEARLDRALTGGT